jgi:hypothetical protein
LNSEVKKAQNPEEMITVVDRQGRKKTIPRAEYERKKKRKKRREKNPAFSLKTIFSVIIILAVMFIAAYIALKIVE